MTTPKLSELPFHRRLHSQSSTRGETSADTAPRTPHAGKSPFTVTPKALLAVVAAARVLLVCAALSAVPARAVIYDFFTVTLTSTNTAKLTSPNGNGYITVTTVGSNVLPYNNSNYPAYFPNLFSASGQVDGYITRYDDLSTNTTTFVITNYQFTPNTVFGIWNMTEESNTYSIKTFTAGGSQNAPIFTWSLMGYDDDQFHGNIGWVHIVLNTNTGAITTTNNLANPNNPNDSDGIFWTNIPTATAKIVITGNVPYTGGANTPGGGDGVVYYFAEPRPCKIICPSNIVITACGGTNVYFPTPALDGNCGTNTPQLLSDLPSGSFFHVGTNLVVWYVPGYPNSSCSFTVTVINTDTNPPTITCPNDITVFTCGTNVPVTYTATASDGTNPAPVILYSTPSGTYFPTGTNQVGCTAIDACSNTATCAFNVIVKLIPPTWTLICPNESTSVNVTGCPPVLPSLTYLVSVSNACPIPGGLSITQSPPPGTILSVGLTNVIINVCATNGQCSNCVVVVNATLGSGCCTIACPTNPVIATTCSSNAVVTFATPAISGPCVSNATVFCAPPSGSTFLLGTNTVVCLATNGAGITVASCGFNVIVVASAFTNAYDFLPVTITGPGAKFSSLHGNGVITVTNTGGPFLGLNNNIWASQFTNLFAASGTVTGWLAQADNFARYTNTFYLAGYTLKTNTVFGIWNITEEANTYSIRLLDGSGNQIAPVFNWNFLGYDDDALAGNIAWYHMNLNTNTGFFSPVPYKLSGIDCDGAFWENIPLTTKKIVVTGSLGQFNADGVVFYFAERRPCPVIPCPFCPVDLGLSATLARSAIILSWTQTATNYVLEGTSDLIGAGWSAITNSPVATNGVYQVALPAQHPRMFYRLKQTQSP